MKKVKLFFTALVLMLSAGILSAQNISVSGNVSDASNGDPIPGATIQVKGSESTYALSSVSGNYRISVPADGSLIVSCLGFEAVEVSVGGRSLINVQLRPESQKLDDVIVVAYGTVRREAATGSVAAMKADQLVELPATSIDKMLSGKMAGVQMSSYSGQPGSTTTIRVRGTSSINAGNEPLWVVDGIPIIADDNRQFSNYGVGGGTNTAFLNPNDIESITVLKDAAAASVYGSRAANGVILVTTKSGKAGKAKFTAQVKFGAQQLANDNNLRPLTGEELITYWRDAVRNAGQDPDNPTSDYYVPYTLLKDGSHNWYKDLTKIGTLQEYEINATGGNDRGSYYSSLSFHKNDGVFNANSYSRFSARINADYKLTKTLTSGARVNVSYNESSSTIMGNSYYLNPAQSMFALLPWTPVQNPDGSYTHPSENGGENPLAHAFNDENLDKEYRFNGTMFLEWKPIPQLSFKTTNSAELSFVESRAYNSPVADTAGESWLDMYNSKERRLTTSNTINFADQYGDHSVRLLVGQEAMIDTYDYLGVDSPHVDPAIPFPTTSTQAEDRGDYYFSEYSLLSFFGVADYNYASKYFVSASVRADGSSLFGSANKWGVFWSLSGSWNIFNESFMDFSRGWLSSMKLRVSYGVNGNNNIAPYRAYGVYGTTQYNTVNGMLPSRPDNPNLSWEKNKTWNIGGDIGFFDNRLTGSLDIYSRLTTDMLLSKQVPYTTGFGSNFMNVGSLRNRGIELTLDGTIIQNKDWLWTAGLNISWNRTRVLDLAGSGYLTTVDSRTRGSAERTTPVRIVEGMRLYNFYVREYAGVNPSTGEGLFVAEDGSLTSDRTKARYIYAGSPEPQYTGGFNTQLTWKGLTLSAFFEFVVGNKVLTNNWYIYDGEDALTANATNNSLNYWKNPGDTGVTPKPIAGGSNVWYTGYSTRFIEDGSYMRIRDITLSYSLPEKILKPIKMSGIKVYISALNPYTFHNVNALDPELGPLGYTYGGNHSMVKSLIGGVEISF